MAKISVIIPTYNTGEYLIKTLVELEKQTFKDFEVIIVDDGSTDATQVLLDQYFALTPTLKVVRVRQDHLGSNIARNTGYKEAKGEFLLFLDADKLLKPDALSSFLKKLLLKPKKAYAYCWFERDGVSNKAGKFDEEKLKTGKLLIDMCSLIRTKFFTGFDENLKRLQDWDLWLSILSKGGRGVRVKKTLFTTVSRDGDITSSEDLTESDAYIRKKHGHKFRIKPTIEHEEAIPLDTSGLVDIVVVRFNTPDQDKACFDSIIDNTGYPNTRLVFYDNSDKKDSLSVVWNDIVGRSNAQYICLLHSDVELPKNWLKNLLKEFKADDVGAVGPSFSKCWTAQKMSKSSKPRRRTVIDFHEEYGKVFQLSNICLVFPKYVFDEVGPFSEDFYLHSEMEWLHRVQEHNFKTLWRKDVYVEHVGGASSHKRTKSDKKFDLFEQKRKENRLYMDAVNKKENL